ncbi:MAG: hypothetical protein ACO39X_08225, partial [Candidatus Nanopelagicaceae bacterium]
MTLAHALRRRGLVTRGILRLALATLLRGATTGRFSGRTVIVRLATVGSTLALALARLAIGLAIVIRTALALRLAILALGASPRAIGNRIALFEVEVEVEVEVIATRLDGGLVLG